MRQSPGPARRWQGGAEIIVQGAFRSGGWAGRTDVLRRIETPSDLGPWSYEIIDTKLARETKGGTVLQLCLYAELVASVQGVRPANCYVVAPWSDFEPQAYRMDDYGAYFRRVRDGLIGSLDLRGRRQDLSRSSGALRNLPMARAMRHAAAKGRSSVADRRRHKAANRGTEAARRRYRGGAGRDAGSAFLEALAGRGGRHTSGCANRRGYRSRAATRENCCTNFFPLCRDSGLPAFRRPLTATSFSTWKAIRSSATAGLNTSSAMSLRSADGSVAYTADWVFTRYDEKQAFERFVDFVMARLADLS